MGLSGMALDVYDDRSQLKEIYPSIGEIPETVKTAHSLTEQEQRLLPDDLFALVVRDGSHTFRKYACIDSGNTELSIEYFLKNAYKLDPEVQKTAAQKLIEACDWYDLQPPEPLQKLAMGLLQGAQLALTGPSMVRGTAQKVKANLAANDALAGSPGLGSTVVTPHQRETFLKGAEASGTRLLPNQPPGTPTKGSRFITNSGVEKSGSHYALGDKYPLDSYAQVKQASAFFEEHRRAFSPEDRHDYCVNLVKRASELGIDLSEEARRYGSEKYAPEEEIKVAFDLRQPHFSDVSLNMLNGLLAQKPFVDPEVFAESLELLDKIAMVTHLYDKAFPDAYASTFGIEKKAEEDKHDSWLSGNDYVSRETIEKFGFTGFSTLEASFGTDFAKKYVADPWAVFMSLTVHQKKMIARMATDNSPGTRANVP